MQAAEPTAAPPRGASYGGCPDTQTSPPYLFVLIPIVQSIEEADESLGRLLMFRFYASRSNSMPSSVLANV